MDESGNILSPEQPGEVVVRSDLVMECYYRNPEATAEVSAHGWHHTGDVGRKDQDGFLYIMDRKKDMIISGGFNIFPTEVERALLTHPSIQDCAVVGVPDEKWGEAVLAAVELKQGASASTEEIIAYCKERLGSLKAPKKVEFVETLIRSTNGKVLRREVRAKYWKGRERNV
jgi:acyl-CoA synthetase (AMP-forming)/AMP-acid ligase II